MRHRKFPISTSSLCKTICLSSSDVKRRSPDLQRCLSSHLPVKLSGCNPYVQISVFWFSKSALSTTTDFPFGAMDSLAYSSGFVTTPTLFPLRSNQRSCESAAPLLSDSFDGKERLPRGPAAVDQDGVAGDEGGGGRGQENDCAGNFHGLADAVQGGDAFDHIGPERPGRRGPRRCPEWR